MRFIRNILSHNWFAILYFNFKMLPFKQAIKLPFDFYYKIQFENLSGKVFINTPKITRGMIKFGAQGSEMFPHLTTILDIKGRVNFSGTVTLGVGSLLRVEKEGTIFFGDGVAIGACSKIFCEQSISFGNMIDFSWECQIFDTNFHHMQEVVTGEKIKRTQPVKIGSYNWIGNRVTIMKGTITLDNTIVASNSLCNKDYSDIEPYSVLAGIPSKVVKSGVRQMFDKYN